MDADAYLLELTRYVVLNPVRAGIVVCLEQWPWSSYQAMINEVAAPPWLATDGLLAQFSQQCKEAIEQYKRFVAQGVGQESLWKQLNRQVFLGDDNFVLRMQDKIKKVSDDVNIPKAQRRPPALPLDKIAKNCNSGNEAIVTAYSTEDYSYQQIAQFFEIHFSTVGHIVRKAKQLEDKQ